MTTATTPARTRRSIRVVPALALASAVIVVSVAGSATAAKMITGKQIKNGSITSIDVRNANLTGADVKDGTVSGGDLKDATVGSTDLKDGTVAGADVQDGSLTGAELAEGTITAEDMHFSAEPFVYPQSLSFLEVPACDDSSMVSCTALLSAGTSGPKHVIVTGQVDNAGANPASISNKCGLWMGNELLNQQGFSLGGNGQPGEIATFALQGVRTVPESGSVELRCSEMAGDNLRLTNVRLTVSNLTFID